MEVIDLKKKLELFQDYWNPRIIGELNGQHLKLAKLKGEFVWHAHKNEDELFMVIKGELKIAFRDKMVTLTEGQVFIVPRGVEHKPIADDEVWVMLFEPVATKHTGEVEHPFTVKDQKHI